MVRHMPYVDMCQHPGDRRWGFLGNRGMARRRGCCFEFILSLGTVRILSGQGGFVCRVFTAPVITGLLSQGGGGGALATAKVTLFRDFLHPAFLLVCLSVFSPSPCLTSPDLVTMSSWLAWNLLCKLSWPQTRKFCSLSTGIRGVHHPGAWVLRTFYPLFIC